MNFYRVLPGEWNRWNQQWQLRVTRTGFKYSVEISLMHFTTLRPAVLMGSNWPFVVTGKDFPLQTFQAYWREERFYIFNYKDILKFKWVCVKMRLMCRTTGSMTSAGPNLGNQEERVALWCLSLKFGQPDPSSSSATSASVALATITTEFVRKSLARPLLLLTAFFQGRVLPLGNINRAWSKNCFMQ